MQDNVEAAANYALSGENTKAAKHSASSPNLRSLQVSTSTTTPFPFPLVPPMAESPQKHTRRRSWIPKFGDSQALPAPQEGQELSLSGTTTSSPAPPVELSGDERLINFTRSDDTPRSRKRPVSASAIFRPTPSLFSRPRKLSAASLNTLTISSILPSSPQAESSPFPVTNGLQSPQTPSPTGTLKSPERDTHTRSSGSFGKLAFSSVIGGLSALSLSRNNTGEEKPRGRSECKEKTKSRSNSVTSTKEADRSRSRARSQSPFSLRRFRSRDNSPAPLPLADESSDIEGSGRRTPSIRPKTAFTDDPESGSEYDPMDGYDDDTAYEWSDGDADGFDPVTERNTEQNALIVPVEDELLMGEMDAEVDPDPLGEGVNVVVPPEPYFPSTLNRTSAGSVNRRTKGIPKRRKSRHHEVLPLVTSRPIFQRDRCTINLKQGDPDAFAGDGKRRMFIVASDLSEESRYAVEWGIGTVLRDGDELLIVSVNENENKVDPAQPNPADRSTKLRSQQERQGLAYILVRQATSLLQRTRLNVVISCQAWHAKNARHMLLDIVDYNEPAMLIVGSRGLSQIQGILLGSTSHYLIEKCSVPVMVARRRLKRPPRRSAHLSKNRVHVSLAEAGIDRVAPKVDQDVAVMRDEIRRDEDRRDHSGAGNGGDQGDIEEEEDEEDGDSPSAGNQKVAG